jgi:LPS O-antigen subunit length determinant protein (WzzB/FepE family)
MKNNYLADDEIDFRDFIKVLWREKIIILSISIICGLAGYLYASFQPQEFQTEITLKNPPVQLFDVYNQYFKKNNNNNNNSTATTLLEQFISDFKLNFFSLDNLESFVEENREIDKFKGYLKSKNITAKKYFKNKIHSVKEKNINILNKYSLIFSKELDGDIFLNNYAEFIKKKTILEFKKNIKLVLENKITITEQAFQHAKIINLEKPILISESQSHYKAINEPDALFYNGTKILDQEIINLKKLFLKLENDQFNYNFIIERASYPKLISKSNAFYFLIGIFVGLFFSIVIIISKSILQRKS